MSIDEPGNHKHAAMIESPDHPGWLEVARKQEAEERAARKRESDALMASESVEAEEARWSSLFKRSAAEREAVHYDDRPGIDRRMFG